MPEINKTEDILKKIKERGYWKIVIRPTENLGQVFDKQYDLEVTMSKSKVSLRGWDFPHGNINLHEGKAYLSKSSEQDYFKWDASDRLTKITDWEVMDTYEIWSAYTDGQFVYFGNLSEDYYLDEARLASEKSWANVKSAETLLSIVGALYRFTEVYNFAAGLYKNIEQVNQIEIIIELHGAKNRGLFFSGEPMRNLHGYICEYENNLIRISDVVKKENLIVDKNSLAIDKFAKFLEDFGCHIYKKIWEADQEKLLRGL